MVRRKYKENVYIMPCTIFFLNPAAKSVLKSIYAWKESSCVLTQNKLLGTTSSTAQGGGGSFKNRKPIGEMCCCESQVAEQKQWWMKVTKRLHDCLCFNVNERTLQIEWVATWSPTKKAVQCERTLIFVRLTPGDAVLATETRYDERRPPVRNKWLPAYMTNWPNR